MISAMILLLCGEIVWDTESHGFTSTNQLDSIEELLRMIKYQVYLYADTSIIIDKDK